jgi:O-antigen/teichoic acid export membrane protein
MVIASVAQVALLMEIFPQAVLVRNLKSAEKPDQQYRLYQIVTSTRLCICICGVLAGLYFLLGGRFESQYNLAVLMGMALLIIRAMTPGWAFQGLEKMRTLSLIELALPVLTIAGYSLFLNEGCGPGVDLVIQTANSALILIVSIIVLFRITGWGRFGAWKTLTNLRPREYLKILWDGRWLFLMQSMIYIYGGLEAPLIGYLTGLEQAGMYRTAQSLVQSANVLLVLPPMLLLPRFVEWRKHSAELLWARQILLAKYAAVFCALACVLILLIVPRFHVWWFGSQYAAAAIPAAVISKMVVLINYIFTCGVMADPGKDKSIALSLGAVSLISLSLNLWLIPQWGMLTAAFVNLVSEISVLIITIFLSMPDRNRTAST